MTHCIGPTKKSPKNPTIVLHWFFVSDQQATKYIPEAMGKNMAAEVQVGFARLVLVGHKRLIPNQGGSPMADRRHQWQTWCFSQGAWLMMNL